MVAYCLLVLVESPNNGSNPCPDFPETKPMNNLQCSIFRYDHRNTENLASQTSACGVTKLIQANFSRRDCLARSSLALKRWRNRYSSSHAECRFIPWLTAPPLPIRHEKLCTYFKYVLKYCAILPAHYKGDKPLFAPSSTLDKFNFPHNL